MKTENIPKNTPRAIPKKLVLILLKNMNQIKPVAGVAYGFFLRYRFPRKTKVISQIFSR